MNVALRKNKQSENNITRFDILKAIYDVEKELKLLKTNLTLSVEREVEKKIYKSCKHAYQLQRKLTKIQKKY